MKAQTTDTLFTAITGGFASTVAYLIGGVDNLANALAVFMILDYATGIASSLYLGNGVNSKIAYKGLAKKSGMIAFIILANQLDIIAPGNIGENGFMRDSMMMFVIGMEGISIKENVEKMGFKAPEFIINVFLKMIGKEKNDKDDSKGA